MKPPGHSAKRIPTPLWIAMASLTALVIILAVVFVMQGLSSDPDTDNETDITINTNDPNNTNNNGNTNNNNSNNTNKNNTNNETSNDALQKYLDKHIDSTAQSINAMGGLSGYDFDLFIRDNALIYSYKFSRILSETEVSIPKSINNERWIPSNPIISI